MSESLLKQALHWVEDEAELNKLCQKWRASKMLAVDTEFMRSHTYYPIAGLLQVNDGEANYLIDPTVIDNCSAFAGVLCDVNVVKVLHSCSEDLEVFQHLLGVVPVNLIDTQLAAALCGYGFSVGYANLVRAVLNIELPKEQTRSDWLQRPLSNAQLDYAAIDVEYLYELASVLIVQLNKSERMFWLREDCDRLLGVYVENQSETKAYLRFKQAWRLNAGKLAILDVLAQWRERKARARDVPRNRVIKEHSLMDLAQLAPSDTGQLRQFEGITERMVRADGEELIRLINNAKQLDSSQHPPVLPKPLSGSENKWNKQLRNAVLVYAQEHGLAHEILLKKRDYEAITRAFMHKENDVFEDVHQKLQRYLSGWRYTQLGELLAETIVKSSEPAPSLDLHAGASEASHSAEQAKDD